MNLDQLVRLQNQFDARHRWNPDKVVPNAIFQALQEDLIGIVGEIGEFANIIKKIALDVNHEPALDLAGLINSCHVQLAEELVDVFIYLLRLASHLTVDIEQAYLDKLRANEQRFTRFERQQP